MTFKEAHTSALDWMWAGPKAGRKVRVVSKPRRKVFVREPGRSPWLEWWPHKDPVIERMQERAAVVAMIQAAEDDCTPEYVRRRVGCSKRSAETIARAMEHAFRASRERIERGDHRR